MHTKARLLMMVALLTALSLAAFGGTVQAQDAAEPAAAEDPCIAIIEAGMRPQDLTLSEVTEHPLLGPCLEALSSSEAIHPCIAIMEADTEPEGTPAPEATEDPILDLCRQAMVSRETEGIDAANPATPDAVTPAATESSAPASQAEGTVYVPITVINSNEYADAARVWLTWHDTSTGELTVTLAAYGNRISYYNTGLDITIPNNVVDIAIRIETTRDRTSGIWEFNRTCGFAFDNPPEGFSVFVDINNICAAEGGDA